MADFGIAHFEEEEILTAVETRRDDRLANFLYSAPEQRIRGQRVDGKADIFALGLVLNEMFSGRVPQGAGFRRVSEVSPDYPYLDGLIEQMIQQDPSLRPSVSEVKTELIARGNEFLSVQRLSSLRSEVIPDSEVDDSVVRNPIRLVGTDYRNENLIFTLSTAPPPNWIMAFQNPKGGWQSYVGAGPEYITFSGPDAMVRLGSGMDPQQMVGYMKSYIEFANRQYAEMVSAQHQKRLAGEREQLRAKVAEEQRRQTILAKLKI